MQIYGVLVLGILLSTTHGVVGEGVVGDKRS